MKLAWSDADSYDNSQITVIGVADETGSHSYRKGASQGPDAIRKISIEREVFVRKGVRNVAAAQTGEISRTIFDYGNVQKKRVAEIVERASRDGKFLVTLGGDHSVTAEVLKGIDSSQKKVSVIYFDAHPDFICSSKEYYGSVVCDIREYRNVDFLSSIEVGVRQPEPEELVNIRRRNLETIMPVTVQEKGLGFVLKRIKKRVGRNVYASIDLDVVDPAFAPGVSTPVPGGLSSLQMIYLMKEIAKMGLISMDVVELSPRYDINGMTAHFAARLVAETLSSLK